MQTKLDLSFYNPNFWLSLFKSISLKTTIIKLDQKFFHFISSDGIIIPKKYSNSKPETNEDYTDEKNNDKEDLELNLVFEKIDEEIIKTIENYDGVVFVKLNWKAPKVKRKIMSIIFIFKDVEGWVPQLKCQNMEDVLTALKSSSIIGEMLENW